MAPMICRGEIHRARRGRSSPPLSGASTNRLIRNCICEVLSLARFSHHLTAEARDRPAITSLRLLAVLNVLFKYTSARRAARALY